MTKRNFTTGGLLVLVLLILTGCSTSTEDVEWGYESSNGPAEWANLSDDYATCGDGSEQSPIDITTSDVTSMSDEDMLKIDYSDADMTSEDTGHSVQFNNSSDDQKITFDDNEYDLKQLHFHSPSENTIDGEHYPLEMHLVNQDEDSNTVVISVMFEVGDENEEINDSFNTLGEDTTMNLSNLIPDSGYYQYEGSLTTPPCTEDVQWVVFENPLTVSQEQLDKLNEYHEGNNRPVQDLNDREVTENK